jgi:hypothetical protein
MIEISPIYYTIAFFAFERLYYGIQLVSKKVIAMRRGFSITLTTTFILSPIVVGSIVSSERGSVLFIISIIFITLFGILSIFLSDYFSRNIIHVLNVDLLMLEDGIIKTLDQNGINYIKNRNSFDLVDLNIKIEYSKAGTLAPVGKIIVEGGGNKKEVSKTMYESLPRLLHDKKINSFPLIGVLIITATMLAILLLGGLIYVIGH